MPNVTLGVLLVAVMAVGTTDTAMATHNEPTHARTLQTALVKAYQPCTAPNDNTLVFGTLTEPACSPPMPNDTVCDGFSPNGRGKVKFRVAGASATVDIKYLVAVRGLSAGCEGQKLCLEMGLRMTTDDCQSGSPAGCTVMDQVSAPLPLTPFNACCTVTDGQCKIDSTFKTGTSGAVVGDKNTAIEFLGCGLRRQGGFPAGPAFRCGFLIP